MFIKGICLIGTFSSLWRYKGFIFSIVKREFQSRYMGSLLGIGWSIINPLMLIIVYTVVFSQVMRNRFAGSSDTLAYSIYLCSGLLTWGLFVEIISRSQTMFLENSNLLKKSNFPRICLPIIQIISSSINFLIIFGIFLIFLMIAGRFPGWMVLAIIPILAIQLMFSVGLGVLTGTLNVFFRDIGNGMGIVLQFWFWLTPIVYPIQAISPKISKWFILNPMAAVVSAYQNIFLNNAMPNWGSLLPALVAATFFLLLGGLAFYKLSGDLVDEL